MPPTLFQLANTPLTPAQSHLLIAALVCGYPILWCLIMLFASHVGGWHKIAVHYPAPGPPTGQTFRFCSLSTARLTNYTGVMRATPTPQGLHLQPMLIFRFAHPPILLPYALLPPTPPPANRRTRLVFPVSNIGLYLTLPPAAISQIAQFRNAKT